MGLLVLLVGFIIGGIVGVVFIVGFLFLWFVISIIGGLYLL